MILRRVLAVVVLLLASACGSAGESPYDVPVGDLDLDRDAPAWFDGEQIHVGDEVLPVDPAPHEWVVGPHAVYYRTGEKLYVADGDGSRTIATVGRDASPTLSPDGSLLGFMDYASGPKDDFDTPVAQPVVFDLESGEEVLRGDAGSTDGEDLADLYEDASVGFLGFDDDAAYADDPLRGGLNRYPLDGSASEQIDDEDEPVLEGSLPGRTVGIAPATGDRVTIVARGGADDFAPYSGRLSPDERLVASGGSTGDLRLYDARTGEPTELADGLLQFGGWLPDGRFLGLRVPAGGTPPETIDGSYYPEQLAPFDAEVVACPTDGGSCESLETMRLPHPQSDDPVRVFPAG